MYHPLRKQALTYPWCKQNGSWLVKAKWSWKCWLRTFIFLHISNKGLWLVGIPHGSLRLVRISCGSLWLVEISHGGPWLVGIFYRGLWLVGIFFIEVCDWSELKTMTPWAAPLPWRERYVYADTMPGMAPGTTREGGSPAKRGGRTKIPGWLTGPRSTAS